MIIYHSIHSRDQLTPGSVLHVTAMDHRPWTIDFFQSPYADAILRIERKTASVNDIITIPKMKIPGAIKITALVVLFSFWLGAGNCTAREKRLSLNGTWRFILGDNMKFARPEYNDDEWEKIFVPSTWQDEGFYHYHGYAWYRKTIDLDVESKDVLYLELGRIDDADEVYFNGHLIGSSGGFPPDYFTACTVARRYFIPAERIRKGGKNVIAVRVYDEGGIGGIIGTTTGIYNYNNYTENSYTLLGNWKFHLFDDPKWSEENFNDAAWQNISVPATWESQGFGDYDGFAWYRKTFRLPDNFQGKDMVAMIGKIDDLDEVFINGKYIGGTGSMTRKRAMDEEWTRFRNYSIPDGLLKPGKNNVIAVRVYDQNGAGGIFEGPLTILPKNEYKQFWKKYRGDNFEVNDWFSYFFD
jgi:hypothetical protein